MLSLEYEPALVEAAVLAALRRHGGTDAFHDERDPVYGIADAEAREAVFTVLHVRWFERLALDRPVLEALGERPEIAAGCARGLVTRAGGLRAQGADLLVAPPARPTLLLRLDPGTLATPGALLALLRRELLHVADMLDPGFGYEPRLPTADGGPIHDRRRAERYRVLWDAWVDGRLARRGRAAATARADRLREFRQAFPELDRGAEAAFEHFFGAERRTHTELVRWASP